MAAPKRTKLERDTDTMFLLEMRLQNVPPAEILRRMNRRQEDRVRAQAEAQGLPAAQVVEMVRDAGLSHQTLSNDLRRVMNALKGGAQAAGEMLIYERIRSLELEIAHLNLTEMRAWEAYEQSCGTEVTTTTQRQEAVEIDEYPPGAPDLPDGSRPTQKRKVLRPKSVERQTRNRNAEGRFLDVVLRCVELRARLGGEVFELAARLGMASAMPEGVQVALDGSVESLQRALSGELGLLYRTESRLGYSDGGSSARVELLRTALVKRAAGAGLPLGGGGAQTFELTVREVSSSEE